MVIRLKRSHPEVKKLLAACYPDYTGRKVKLSTAISYYPADYWDGGTRRYVVLYDPTTGRVAPPLPALQDPFTAKAHRSVEVPRNFVLVEHEIFCGHDVGVTIYVHPDSAPRLLAEVQ